LFVQEVKKFPVLAWTLAKTKILPFAKLVALPMGQQRAVIGAVVCLPSDVEATLNCLLRPSNEVDLL